jgi:hypothetical protein
MTPPETGNVLDHLNVTYDYPNKVQIHLAGVQLPPGAQRCEDVLGLGVLHPGTPALLWKKRTRCGWNRSVRFTIDAFENFFDRIVNNRPKNEAFFAAESTFTSLLGRLTTYHRREVTRDEMMQSG